MSVIFAIATLRGRCSWLAFATILLVRLLPTCLAAGDGSCKAGVTGNPTCAGQPARGRSHLQVSRDAADVETTDDGRNLAHLAISVEVDNATVASSLIGEQEKRSASCQAACESLEHAVKQQALLSVSPKVSCELFCINHGCDCLIPWEGRCKVDSCKLCDQCTGATPTPTTATPSPTTATPEPTTATPEPTTATPEPTTVTPEPTTATPEPTTATPSPTNGVSVCEVPPVNHALVLFGSYDGEFHTYGNNDANHVNGVAILGNAKFPSISTSIDGPSVIGGGIAGTRPNFNGGVSNGNPSLFTYQRDDFMEFVTRVKCGGRIVCVNNENGPVNIDPSLLSSQEVPPASTRKLFVAKGSNTITLKSGGNRKKFGDSIIAPNAHVNAKDVFGFVDGYIVAGSLEHKDTGDQLHGGKFVGVVTCH